MMSSHQYSLLNEDTGLLWKLLEVESSVMEVMVRL